MLGEASRVAGHDLGHHVWRSINTEDHPGEVKCLLNRPDLVVMFWREDRGWISDCHPTDRHQCLVGKNRLQLHGTVDAHLRSLADPGAVENCRSGGEEGFVSDRASTEVRPRPNQDPVADAKRVLGCPA